MKNRKIFVEQILQWSHENGRHSLPWKQKDPTGYLVLVSEVMLQQTTVKTVLDRFPKFISQFPDFSSLASAQSDDVFKAWEGLGYYSRAKNLHKSAQKITKDFSGQVPVLRSDRLALPGVGPSTASALGAFVHGMNEPIWDANVARIFSRVWQKQWQGLSPSQQWKKQWVIHAKMIKETDPAQWTQAIMDFGALMCLPKNPNCANCSLSFCQFRKNPKEEARTRSARAQVYRHWFLCEKDNKIALLAPSHSGIWAGLWQLPYQEAPQKSLEVIKQGVHLLTHKKVVWSIAVAKEKKEDPSWLWVEKEKIKSLAFPKPLADFWKA